MTNWKKCLRDWKCAQKWKNVQIFKDLGLCINLPCYLFTLIIKWLPPPKEKKSYQITNNCNSIRSPETTSFNGRKNQKQQIMSLGAVQTAPEEFLIKGFTLKTHQKFFVHTIPEAFKTQQSAVILVLNLYWIEEHSVRKSHYHGKVIKVFPVHIITRRQRFQISPVWKAFRKAPFPWRISVDIMAAPRSRFRLWLKSVCFILEKDT